MAELSIIKILMDFFGKKANMHMYSTNKHLKNSGNTVERNSRTRIMTSQQQSVRTLVKKHRNLAKAKGETDQMSNGNKTLGWHSIILIAS